MPGDKLKKEKEIHRTREGTAGKNGTLLEGVGDTFQGSRNGYERHEQGRRGKRADRNLLLGTKNRTDLD